jgi:hypothetical protein
MPVTRLIHYLLDVIAADALTTAILETDRRRPPSARRIPPHIAIVTLGATYFCAATAVKSAKPLILLVGAQGLEPWAR